MFSITITFIINNHKNKAPHIVYCIFAGGMSELEEHLYKVLVIGDFGVGT